MGTILLFLDDVPYCSNCFVLYRLQAALTAMPGCSVSGINNLVACACLLKRYPTWSGPIEIDATLTARQYKGAHSDTLNCVQVPIVQKMYETSFQDMQYTEEKAWALLSGTKR